MAEWEKCRSCNTQARGAFCARCWRCTEPWMRYELLWWQGEFRAATTDDEAAFAIACWSVVAAQVATAILEVLNKRAAAKLLRKNGAKPKRAKTLAELALEAEDEAHA